MSFESDYLQLRKKQQETKPQDFLSQYKAAMAGGNSQIQEGADDKNQNFLREYKAAMAGPDITSGMVGNTVKQAVKAVKAYENSRRQENELGIRYYVDPMGRQVSENGYLLDEWGNETRHKAIPESLADLPEGSTIINEDVLGNQELMEERRKAGLQSQIAADQDSFIKDARLSGELRDGYQFGDYGKTFAHTLEDVFGGLAKGAYQSVEGTVDLGIYAAAQAQEWAGRKQLADYLRKEAMADSSKLLFKDSGNKVVGTKGSGLVESAGGMLWNIGVGNVGAGMLGKVGGTVASSLATGTSSAGHGITEAYEGGATTGEAWAYGAMKGAVDAGSEMVFGGLGKGLNAVGYSQGLTSLDDMLAKEISDKISNQFFKTMAEYGVKATAEGFEEVLAGLGTALAKKLTYLSEEDWSKLVQDEQLMDQFIAGFVLSAMAQSPEVYDAIKNGTSLVDAPVMPTPQQETVMNGDSALPPNEVDDAVAGSFQDAIEQQWEAGRNSQGTQQEIGQGSVRLADLNVQVDESTMKMAEQLSSVMRRDIVFYTEAGNENGYYQSGVIYINTLGTDPLLQVFSHELTHSIESADAYGSLSKTVLQLMELEGVQLDLARQAKIEQYSRAGHALKNAAAVDQELVAEYVSRHLLTDESSITSLVQQNRNLGQKIKNWFDKLLSLFGNKNAQERAFLERARNIYRKALQQTNAGTQAKNNGMVAPMGGENAGAMGEEADPIAMLDAQLQAGEITEEEYDAAREEMELQQEERMTRSEKQYDLSEGNSIKDQLKDNLAKLDQMDSVAEVQAPAELKNWNMRQIRQWVENELRPTGYQVDRKGFGIIVFDAKRINTSLDYLKPGSAEIAAYAALPKVLKRGIEISGHDNHKGREYGTVTIAAPVILNGKRGNMAVVVKKTSKNFYKMHRILSPDGSVFVLPETEIEAGPRSGGGVTENGSLATPISAASDKSLTEKSDGVKRQHSIREETVSKRDVASDLRQILNRGGSTRELRQYVDGLERGSTGIQKQSEVQRIVEAAKGQHISVEEYLQQNWEQYDQDGQWNKAARQALDMEKNAGRKYSIGDDAEASPMYENIRSIMPKKAQNDLKRTERKLLDDLTLALHVPSITAKPYLEPVIQKLTDIYLQEGTISQENMDLLFDKAYAQGFAACKDYLTQHGQVVDTLKSLTISLSETEMAKITDLSNIQRAARGRIRIVPSGGMTLSEAWKEAGKVDSDLFPNRPIATEGKLWQMIYAVKGAELSQNRFEQFMGDAEGIYRKSERAGFENAVSAVTGDLWTLKRYADEKMAAKGVQKAPMTAEEAMETFKELKKARREYERASAKNLLTHTDEQQVGRLLRHEIELAHLDPKKDNVKGITAVFEAKQEYERLCKQIREYKQHLHGQLAKRADQMLETANNWKDKKIGILYARETMRRNILDIVPDKALAKEILDEYFEPVHIAEAKSTRFKSRFRDRVRQLNLSRKVAKGNLVSEAHAVQLLGEAEDNIRMLENARGRVKNRDGKTLEEWQAIVQKLWDENPNLDKAKVERSVQEFRKLYDELFQLMNDVRVANGYEPINYRNGYFPHFQPGDGDSILAQFGRALGIDTQVETLPTTINGLTHVFRPGIQWFGNAQERLGFNTAYDAVEGFDKYIEGASSVIHQTENIQKLRAFARQIRYRTSDDGIREQVDAVNARTDLTQEEKQVQISAIYEKARFTLSNFVVELDEYTNLLANKKSRYDRAIEAAMGRRAYTILKNLENRVAANMIAGNLTSALTNFIPLTQAGAQMDRFALLKGMWATLQSYKTNDGILEQSSFLTNRKGSDPLVQNWSQKTSDILGKPMEFIDSFTAGAIVRGAYYQNIKRGMSEAEAMYQADIFASNVMADRSKGSTPTLFQASNPLMKAVTQFQLEVNNQFSEVFKDMPRNFKTKGLRALGLALLRYFLGAWLFNELFEKLIGRRPALDPIGIVCDAVDDVRTEGWGTAGTNFAGNVLEQLPFSSAFNIIGIEIDGGRIPVSSAFMDFNALWDAATKEGWSAEKRWKEIQDELNKLAYVLPPFGGNQISKIWKGAKAYIQGGSYSIEDVEIKDEEGNVVDVEGRPALQYPVYKDDAGDAFWNMIKAVLLGKSSLQTAQNWVDSGFDGLNAKQTEAYQDLLAVGVKDKKAFALLQEIVGAQETEDKKKAVIQRDILRDTDIPSEAKAVVYYHLLATDTHVKLMDALADMRADMGQVTGVLMKFRDIDNTGGKGTTLKKLSSIAEAALTDEEKSVLIGSVLGTDLLTDNGNPTQYAKFDYAVKNGMAVDDYIEYRLSGADIDKYLELRDAGLPVQDAMAAGMALAELNDQIEDPSNIQKWRVVIDSTDDPERQLISLSVVMSEKQYAKALTANNFGITPEQYVQVNEQLVRFDADANGSYTQAEVTKALSSMNMLSSMKAVLWQLITGSKSAKNNPFNTSMGQRVIDALAKAEAQQGTSGRSFEEEIMRQIMGG